MYSNVIVNANERQQKSRCEADGRQQPVLVNLACTWLALRYAEFYGNGVGFFTIYANVL